MPWSSFFERWVLSQLFHSPLSPSSSGCLIPLCFLHKGGVIYLSEVIDISSHQPCPLFNYYSKPTLLHRNPKCPLGEQVLLLWWTTDQSDPMLSGVWCLWPQRSGSGLSPWLGKTSQHWLLVCEWSPQISGWIGEVAPGMGGWVFSSPLLNNKPSSSVVWLVVYQLGSVNGSAALPAVCWGWKVQDGDPTPEFGVSARLGNHWGCWLGLSVFMASLGFLTVSPSQSSLT